MKTLNEAEDFEISNVEDGIAEAREVGGRLRYSSTSYRGLKDGKPGASEKASQRLLKADRVLVTSDNEGTRKKALKDKKNALGALLKFGKDNTGLSKENKDKYWKDSMVVTHGRKGPKNFSEEWIDEDDILAEIYDAPKTRSPSNDEYNRLSKHVKDNHPGKKLAAIGVEGKNKFNYMLMNDKGATTHHSVELDENVTKSFSEDWKVELIKENNVYRYIIKDEDDILAEGIAPTENGALKAATRKGEELEAYIEEQVSILKEQKKIDETKNSRILGIAKSLVNK